ncbi:hypothetical protein MMC19_002492 [Ptychographa xylographoides]|nr:hypothetical protein [Ptychographa xylographoides]
MISDVSSRSSRSSSISSVASSTCTLPQLSLAVQATRRCANLQLSGIKEGGTIPGRSSPELVTNWEEFTSSPVSYAVGPKESYLRASREDVKSNIPILDCSDHDTAKGVRDLTLDQHQRILPPLASINSSNSHTRKRQRPNSISENALQQTVSDLLRNPPPIKSNSNYQDADRTIFLDNNIADSFTLRSNFKLPTLDTLSYLCDSNDSARKRACYVNDLQMGLGTKRPPLPIPSTGPGMWSGIL